jgi:hypothetical protein
MNWKFLRLSSVAGLVDLRFGARESTLESNGENVLLVDLEELTGYPLYQGN